MPLEVQKLLQQYPDLTPTNLPAGLPPTRGITHQIDLFPGAKLPNQAAYRMTPFEDEEMRRQITDLVEKGFIHESMSPCATPALLSSKKGGKTWRLCMDSRDINKIIVKYQYMLSISPRLTSEEGTIK